MDTILALILLSQISINRALTSQRSGVQILGRLRPLVPPSQRNHGKPHQREIGRLTTLGGRGRHHSPSAAEQLNELCYRNDARQRV